MAGQTRSIRHLAHVLRLRLSGIFQILLGISCILLLTRGVDPTLRSKFRLIDIGTNALFTLPDIILPSSITIIVLSLAILLLGIYQTTLGHSKKSGKLTWLNLALFVIAFLVWATRGRSMNLTGLLRLTILQAIPLLLGALSGILSERAGVVNIAIEGLMLAAALVSVIVASVTHNLWWGLVAAMIAGALLALVHGILSIHYKVDQIISGMVINIFAIGITSFISVKFLIRIPELNQSGLFPNIAIPVLSRLPVLGTILFNQNIFFYITIALLFVFHFALFYTRWGLRTRMVGEHPKGADTLGVDVYRIRYLAVVLSGIVAGIGGAYLTLGAVGRFDRLMTSGRGFIGLAAMIFGNWNPFGALGASLIFGFSSTLQSKLSILQVPIPSQFLLMAPYLATMIILAGVIGNVTAPAADGQPYEGRE